MKKGTIIIVAVLVVVIGIGAAVGITALNSPEYALMQIAKDVKADGIDGLTPHLTSEARDTVEKITSIADNKLVNSIISFFNKGEGTDTLIEKLSDVEWKLEDIEKGKKSATVHLGFNYEDKVIGTVEIEMIKEDGDWKISSIEMPKITENNL